MAWRRKTHSETEGSSFVWIREFYKTRVLWKMGREEIQKQENFV